MRPDIVSGAVFPGHEPSGDTAKRQKLRELPGHMQWFSFWSLAGY